MKVYFRVCSEVIKLSEDALECLRMSVIGACLSNLILGIASYWIRIQITTGVPALLSYNPADLN